MTSLTDSYSMRKSFLNNHKTEIEGPLLSKLQVQLAHLHVKARVPKLQLQIPLQVVQDPRYACADSSTPSPRDWYPYAPSTPTYRLPPVFYSRLDRLAHSRIYVYSTDRIWLRSIFPSHLQSKLSVVLVDTREDSDLELTVLDGLVYFDQYNPLVVRHLGSRMRKTVEADDVDTIRAVVKASFHFRHDLTRSSPRQFGNVWMELKKLSEVITEEYDRMFKPIGKNLIAEEPATIIIDQDAALGITIHNDSDRALYPYLFYFDPTELTIECWYLPPVDAPLPPRSMLAIGTGINDDIPWSLYIPNSDVKLDLGFFRLFLSPRPTSFENIMQERTPFEGGSFRGPKPTVQDFLLEDEEWSVQTVTLIQIDA